MKLRNKKTGKVENFCIDKDKICSCNRAYIYDRLAELQADGWQDYEEPKDFYYIQPDGDTHIVQCKVREYQLKKFKDIGNYFETKEEAEKAVEKLKAFKRLKDLGFKCSYHSSGYHRGTFTADFIFDADKLPIMDTFVAKDLDLVFGGEE